MNRKKEKDAQVVTTELVDSICILLGHPETCPHGMPIPPGSVLQTFCQDRTQFGNFSGRIEDG
ncbi:MAG: iron dependent repressor, metal binding and dimerization domain protein [Planctomycetota bacterium]|jgi:Mn-dependent DtxR family transcriptional regulator